MVRLCAAVVAVLVPCYVALDVNYHDRCAETLQTFIDFENIVIPENQKITFDDPFNCQTSTTTYSKGQDPRESMRSDTSQSIARERALVQVLNHVASAIQKRKYNCLTELSELSIWNTVTYGALHDFINKEKNSYVASENLPTKLRSGTILNGVRHEDLENPSFTEPTFDIIISSEIFEHVPHPYLAHQKLLNALKPGGAHVFVVPFAAGTEDDIVMARMLANGTVVNGPGNENLKPPHYHGDRFHPEPGWLVYNIFAQQMLRVMCKMGYDVTVHHIQNRQRAIMSMNFVFVAWKRKGSGVGSKQGRRGCNKED